MSMPNAVQGGIRPSPLLIWYQEDSTEPESLLGATLSGFIRNAAGVTRAITGDLTVTDALEGEFRWDLSLEDVADAGRMSVQFVADFPLGQTPAKTLITDWDVKEALSA
jgi:hypothetical protein